jgi:hypothetical protein
MPNGAYRIGPSDIFTSGDLLADANTLNGQMNSLDDQDFTKVSQALFDGWNSFLQEWRAFYKSTFGGLFNTSAWNNGNRDELIQFESRFAAFADQYKTESGNSLPGGVVNVSSGTKDTLGDQLKNQLQPLLPSINMTYVLVGAGLVVLAGALYIFRKPLSNLGS